jgi:phosphoserine aminotransferase
MNDFLTFNPGPSQLSESTKLDIQMAIKKHVVELSHRSKDFSCMSQKAIMGLRDFFQIPPEYEVFYTSSATEAMILSIQNCVDAEVFHFVNGSFSKKFAEISSSLRKKMSTESVLAGTQNNFPLANIAKTTELLTLTANETSTGVMARREDIAFLREKFQDMLFVVDATSLAGGIALQICDADIWLFSVQKCFGLPSGLGIMMVSPRAMEKSRKMREEQKNTASLFCFEELKKYMNGKHQTVQTPNILNIFLLAEQLERWNANGGMKKREEETLQKYAILEKYFMRHADFSFFVEDARFRSPTVLCIKGDPKKIEEVHERLLSKNILLGKGYGERKKDSFRIANFPAHTLEHISILIGFLEKF